MTVEALFAQLVRVRDQLVHHQQEEMPSKWRWGSRARWARELESLRRSVQEQEARVLPRIGELVGSLIHNALETERVTTRHTYHPELLEVLEDIAPTVAARARATEWDEWRRVVTPSGVGVTGYFTACDIPEVESALTPAAVEAHVKSRVQRFAAVAADSGIEYIQRGDDDLVLEHVCSGIALEVSLSQARAGFGSVLAGRHKVWPGEDPCAEYHGLGIGRMLYRKAAAIYPEVRWTSNATTDEAIGLRRALHSEDPWRWERGGCQLCQGAWADRARGDFGDHPSAGEER